MSLVTQVRVGFEPPTSHQTLVAASLLCDECGWNYMDMYPEDPGSNPGGSILCGAVAQWIERECFTNTCRRDCGS